MTKKERSILEGLHDRYNATNRYAARDKAWSDLQDFAEARGYGCRFCSLDAGMEWLMSSSDLDTRLKALRLYGVYCAAVEGVDAANHIGQAVAELK